jgi:hypothetical protein
MNDWMKINVRKRLKFKLLTKQQMDVKIVVVIQQQP